LNRIDLSNINGVDMSFDQLRHKLRNQLNARGAGPALAYVYFEEELRVMQAIGGKQ